jgi:hypothetical protein
MPDATRAQRNDSVTTAQAAAGSAFLDRQDDQFDNLIQVKFTRNCLALDVAGVLVRSLQRFPRFLAAFLCDNGQRMLQADPLDEIGNFVSGNSGKRAQLPEAVGSIRGFFWLHGLELSQKPPGFNAILSERILSLMIVHTDLLDILPRRPTFCGQTREFMMNRPALNDEGEKLFRRRWRPSAP